MICLGKAVIQLDPHSSDFSNSSNQSNSSNSPDSSDLLLPYEVASALLKNSGATWNDVVYVYQFVSRELDLKWSKLGSKAGRKSKPNYVQDHVYIYFQRANGERDLKYVPGLDFLVPVDNLFKDMVKFFTGGRI